MKIKIEKNKLDNREEKGSIELKGLLLAYFPDSDNDNPSYMIFSDTSKYYRLWREVTKDFNPCEDWGEHLRKVYQKHPELEKKLSVMSQYKVPSEALKIVPFEVGGAHGDLRLMYRNANIIFFPLKDYETHFSKDFEFFRGSKVILSEHYGKVGFLKGNKKMLSKLGIKI